MSDKNIVLTGAPRSGTTLTCHLLNKVPNTVALHEPMRVSEFAQLENLEAICQSIARFCSRQRESIHTRKRAISKQANGAVPDNTFETNPSGEGLRKTIVSLGEVPVDKELSQDFTLVIKHVVAFAAILEEAVKHFPVYAIVRNPLATLASWNTVDFDSRRGHARAADRLNPALAEKLAAIDDQLDRQFYLLGWFHEQFHRYLPAHSIIRYESIIASGGRSLSVLQPGASELAEPLQNRNTNTLYDREGTLRIGERLLKSDGAYWESYSKASVEHLLAEFAREPTST